MSCKDLLSKLNVGQNSNVRTVQNRNKDVYAHALLYMWEISIRNMVLDCSPRVMISILPLA